jgi:magnesium-transporting ATPase (P-type)
LTDKTGTLTENKIYVETLAFPDENRKVSIEKDVKQKFLQVLIFPAFETIGFKELK